MATYVCSDIHGNFDIWLKALKKSGLNLEKGDELIILGDLIDKGEKSIQCVFYALDLLYRYPDQVTYIMGNHERLFLDFVTIKDPKSDNGYIDLIINGDTWLGNGGTQTITSFLGGLPESLFDTHKFFNDQFPVIIEKMSNLPYYKVDEKRDIVYVHAGFEPNIPLSDQDEDVMTWIRHDFINRFKPVKNDVLDSKLIIHGHTPVQYFKNYDGNGFYKGEHHICVDGGASSKEKIIVLRIDDMTYTEVSCSQ